MDSSGTAACSGHSSYEIGAGAEQVFYLGDLAHHPVISVQRPAWSIQVDADRPAAEAMRQQTLAKLAAGRMRVFVGTSRPRAWATSSRKGRASCRLRARPVCVDRYRARAQLPDTVMPEIFGLSGPPPRTN
jgi:hypothetical protein